MSTVLEGWTGRAADSEQRVCPNWFKAAAVKAGVDLESRVSLEGVPRMLINLIFVFVLGFLLLALVFMLQKQRLIRPNPAPPPRRSPRPAPRSTPRPAPALAPAPPLGRPRVDLHHKPPTSAGVPESAIKAVTVYTHDRATSERLLQSYRQTHGRGWGETADQVIRDLVRERR